MSRFVAATAALVFCLLAASLSSAQPTIPKEQIPSGLDAETRAVFEDLYSIDSSKRRHAIMKVVRMTPEARTAVIPFLVAMLGDDAEWEEGDPRCEVALLSVNRELTDVLAGIGKPATEALITALNDDQPAVRRGAARVLERTASPKAVTPLIDALKDTDWGVRVEAAKALGRYPEQRVVSALATVLDDKSPDVRRWTISSLAKIGPPAGDVLFATATDPSMPARQAEALGALVSINDPRAPEQVLAAFQSESPDMRRSAASAAFMLKTPEIILGLVRLLDDPDETVRQYAIGSLGRIGGPGVVPHLIQALEHHDPCACGEAALWLAWIGDRQAVGPLISRLGDMNDWTREIACNSLREMTGQEFGCDVEKWQAWWAESQGSGVPDGAVASGSHTLPIVIPWRWICGSAVLVAALLAAIAALRYRHTRRERS